MHTKEETTVTFKRDGRYDSAALEKLNWALRDWRTYAFATVLLVGWVVTSL